jgi:hypothetical protein
MCNINIPSVRSFFNFVHSGVPVGYVTFTRLRICNINIISVDSFFNLPSMHFTKSVLLSMLQKNGCM